MLLTLPSRQSRFLVGLHGVDLDTRSLDLGLAVFDGINIESITIPWSVVNRVE